MGKSLPASIIIHIAVLIFIFFSQNVQYIGIVSLIYAILLLYNSRHNILKLFSVSIVAYSVFSFLVLRYWSPDFLIVNEGITEKWIDLIGIRCVSFFMLSLYCADTIFFPRKNRINYEVIKNRKNIIRSHSANTPLVFLSCIIIVLIWVFFYDFNYGTGDRAGYSPIYEYSTIFFIMGFWYAGENKILRRVVLFFALFYILFDFMGGQRSTGVQVAIIMTIMLFYKHLNIRRLAILFVVGIIVVRIVAIFRNEFDVQGINMAAILGDDAYAVLASDTSGMAYYTSLTFIGTTQFYTVLERFIQFLDYLLSQILVGSVGKSVTELALQHYVHYYGGVLPIYLYYYIGYVGTFLISLLVAKYYSIMDKVAMRGDCSALVTMIAVYVSATTIRWFLYSPNQLLRGVLLLTLVYWGYSTFANSSTKKTKETVITE